MKQFKKLLCTWVLVIAASAMASGAHALLFTGGDDGEYTFTELLNYDGGGDSKEEVPVPEPGTIALLGLGLVGLGIARGKRKR